MTYYWRECRREAAHVGMLEVVADGAAVDMARFASLLRAWAQVEMLRGMPACHAEAVLRIAAAIELRAADVAKHREHFEECAGRYGFGDTEGGSR